MLVDGKWNNNWKPFQGDEGKGRFVRETAGFRHWVTVDGAAGPTGEAGFKAEAGRYHLYVALICPWACRTLALRKLKGLEDVISISIVEPFLTEGGWRFGDFPGASGDDPHLGARHMHEIYSHSDPHYTGRATVPVLWDKQARRIVNNESADIIKMLNDAFAPFATRDADLRPVELEDDINDLNTELYEKFNNGVYKTGFAQTQDAYEEAVAGVFDTLEVMEERLADGRNFLHGDKLTETDIRAFVTLVRFDTAYHGLFKCNLKRIVDYPLLSAYMRRIYDIEGIDETVNLAHIKQGYYSIKAINPNQIYPIGPADPLGA